MSDKELKGKKLSLEQEISKLEAQKEKLIKLIQKKGEDLTEATAKTVKAVEDFEKVGLEREKLEKKFSEDRSKLENDRKELDRKEREYILKIEKLAEDREDIKKARAVLKDDQDINEEIKKELIEERKEMKSAREQYEAKLEELDLNKRAKKAKK